MSKREDLRIATLEFLKRTSQFDDKIYTHGQKMESLISVKGILSELLAELLSNKILLCENMSQLAGVAKAIQGQLKPSVGSSTTTTPRRPPMDMLEALAVSGRLEAKHSTSAVASVMWIRAVMLISHSC